MYKRQVVGDSDLGLTMSDGFRAASEAANACELTDVGKLCYQAGQAMATAVPSTMGTLMASGLMNSGKVLKGMEQLTPAQEAQLLDVYKRQVSNRRDICASAPPPSALPPAPKRQTMLDVSAESRRLITEDLSLIHISARCWSG